MRLALAMGKSFAEVKALDGDELTDWLGFEEVEGLDRPWLRSGILAAVCANPHRKEGARPFSPSDFIPVAKPPKRQKTAEEIRAAFAAMRAQG